MAAWSHHSGNDILLEPDAQCAQDIGDAVGLRMTVAGGNGRDDRFDGRGAVATNRVGGSLESSGLSKTSAVPLGTVTAVLWCPSCALPAASISSTRSISAPEIERRNRAALKSIISHGTGNVLGGHGDQKTRKTLARPLWPKSYRGKGARRLCQAVANFCLSQTVEVPTKRFR